MKSTSKQVAITFGKAVFISSLFVVTIIPSARPAFALKLAESSANKVKGCKLETINDSECTASPEVAADAETVTAGTSEEIQSPTPAPPAQAAPAPTAAPADAAPAAATWSVGPIEFSGLIDGYYSYNYNRPSNTANGQVNDYYNFNDKTDQFNLSMAKLTLNHDPDPVGVHVDVIFGRTNTLINQIGGSTSDNGNYLEQGFISLKPAKAKGLELDFGKFVTSAGAEVIESKDNWNYSRSFLFVYAIPYFHFGLRSSMPVTKTWTAGVQLVNGWNTISKSNGGVTVGLTSVLTKTKYTWSANYYFGPENSGTQKGYRNLIDTTLLLTPTAKFNAYLNYDYSQNRDAASWQGDTNLNHWQGFAGAVHEQLNAKNALAARGEYFYDPQGFTTGKPQKLKEVTATYEYKWLEGLLTRIEYRHDWSNVEAFHKGNTSFVDAQSTLTAGFVAFFGPKR
jgi:hypothetical protein